MAKNGWQNATGLGGNVSKELIERLRKMQREGWATDGEIEAADLIEQQQKRIEELEAKMADDWCGCVGIHNHRLGVCTTCNKPVIGWREVAESAIEDLAAAQAQLVKMREALENVEGALDESGMYQHYPVTYDLAIEALAQPTDDSALREMLKQERERCAKVCMQQCRVIEEPHEFERCAEAIRAMEDKPEKTHTLICPRCGVDRFKVPCPGPLHLCPIHGEAQSMEDK